MALSIKGINTLVNKLNKLDNIKAKQAIENVAKTVEESIKKEASTFSSEGVKHVGTGELREYPNGSCYIDIGFDNIKAPWDEWKHLYYHHYGYSQFFYGKPLNKMTTMHQFWFTNAVDNMSQDVLKSLKEDLKKEINNALKG